MPLTNKRAIVVGGSRGIGAAIARRFASDGATVALTYAGSRDAAEALATDTGATAIHGDAGDPASARAAIESAAETLGGIDVLVYNAGVGEFATINQASEDSYRRQFAVNVDGLFHSVTAALPHLTDNAAILVIGSVNGNRMPTPGGSIYGATKAAVQGLARGWARDLGARGIRVNVIQPGPVDTDMNPAEGDMAKTIMHYIALGRYGRAEEIAAFAAFLASDEAAFITGAMLDIDGGFSI